MHDILLENIANMFACGAVKWIR